MKERSKERRVVRPRGNPCDCRCACCVAALADEPRPEGATCPWDGILTEGDLFPALYLPTWDERGILFGRTDKP